MKPVINIPALLLLVLVSGTTATSLAQECNQDGIWVQVLGSGGSDLGNNRASSGILIRKDGKPRILIDTGSGTARNFFDSGATIADLDSILFTHLHVDHSGDLPALINASAGQRKTPLPIYGPDGNKNTPSTVSFTRTLFDEKRGAFRHLGSFLSPLGKKTYKLQPHNIVTKIKKAGPGLKASASKRFPVYSRHDVSITAIPVTHSNVPTLAYRINIGDRTVVVGGDITYHKGNIDKLAKDADMLILSHAAIENPPEHGPTSYISPSVIGRIAYRANAKQLLLTHRSTQTLGKEKESLEAIRGKYAGLINFANDMDCFQP